MKIEIKKVTKENLEQVKALHVKNAQVSYVETVEESLADAREQPEYRPVGLYRNSELVGFAMYGFFEREGAEGKVWLDRFFIDEHFQGMGFGSEALDSLLRHLESRYNCKEIYLSLYEDNQHALGLYEKFGFTFTGDLDINGEKVMIRKV